MIFVQLNQDGLESTGKGFILHCGREDFRDVFCEDFREDFKSQLNRAPVLRAEVHVGDGDALHRVHQVQQVEGALVDCRGLHVQEDARGVDGLEELDGVALEAIV